MIIFLRTSLTKALKKNASFKNGAKTFLHPVKNAQQYGVAILNKNKKILKLDEKLKDQNQFSCNWTLFLIKTL